MVDATTMNRIVGTARSRWQKELRERNTAAQRRLRRRSRTAFRNLDAAQAAAVANRFFHLSSTTGDVLPIPHNARITRTLDATNAVMALPGGKRVLLRSTLPLHVQSGKNQALMSLSLRARGDALAPAHPLMPLTISRSLAAGVTLGNDIRFRPVADHQDGAARELGDQVFFPNTGRDTDFSVKPTPLGVETFWDLRAPDSPQKNALQFTLPHGMTMRLSPVLRGGVEIDRGPRPYFVIPPPAIHDADGMSLRGRFLVNGNRLTVDVPHRSADVKYPLEIDPLIEGVRAWYGTNTNPGSPNASFPQSAWAYTTYPANNPSGWTFEAPWMPAYSAYDELAIVSTKSTTGYSGGWAISAGPPNDPSFTGYIWRVDLDGVYSTAEAPWNEFYAMLGPATTNGTPVWTNDAFDGAQGDMSSQLGDDFYTNTNAISDWGYTFCAASGGGADGQPLPLCDATKGPHNNIFEFGIGTTQSYNPGWMYVIVQGAQVMINDTTAPTTPTITGAPSGWVQQGPTALQVTASQPGLGLGSFYVTDNGVQYGATQNVTCSNAWTQSVDPYSLASLNYNPGTPCPTSHTASFNLSGLPEGSNTIVAHAVSLLGYDTPSTPVTINVDHTGPNINVTGATYDASQSSPATIGGGPTTVGVDAQDGDDSSSTATSGVTRTELKIDGVDANPSADLVTQSCPSGSCDLSTNFAVDTSQLSAGSHTFEVIATDQAGNANTLQWSVTVQPTTPLPASSSAVPAQSTPTSAMSNDTAAAVSSLQSTFSTILAASQSTSDPAGILASVAPEFGTVAGASGALVSIQSSEDSATGGTAAAGYQVDTAWGALSVTPVNPSSNAQPGAIVNGTADVFADTAQSADTILRPTAEGMADYTQIHDATAPQTYSWTLGLDDDEALELLPNGAIALYASETPSDSQVSQGNATTDANNPLSSVSNNPSGDQVSDPAFGTLPTSTLTYANAATPTTASGVSQLLQDVSLTSAQFTNAAADLSYAGQYFDEQTQFLEAVIPPAWAVDADGHAVPAAWSVNGDTVTMTVQHQAGNYAYPVMAASETVECKDTSPCGNYNANEARTYAEHWSNANNPKYVNFDGGYFCTQGIRCDDDCTNYMSQIYQAGGGKFLDRPNKRGDYSWWEYLIYGFHGDPESDHTLTWSVARDFYHHLLDYGLAKRIYGSYRTLGTYKAGDMIAWVWHSNQTQVIEHVDFVTEVDASGQPFLLQHSPPASGTPGKAIGLNKFINVADSQGLGPVKWYHLRPVHIAANGP
jgi:hypothetical protein